MSAGSRHDILLEPEYLDLTYSAERNPPGGYPTLLCEHVAQRFYRPCGRLLDFGCGRGDHLDAFAATGLQVAGADISPRAPELSPHHEIAVIDPQTTRLPYPDASFDFVFSKSVVEHMAHPSDLAREACRVLRPGGVAVVMTPSWQHNAWGPFYIDHTHVTPFTAPSLRDLLELAGFEHVSSEHFLQLPFTWRRPALRSLSWMLAKLPLPYRPYHQTAPWSDEVNKLIRFSKEVMLLAAGRRPDG